MAAGRGFIVETQTITVRKWCHLGCWSHPSSGRRRSSTGKVGPPRQRQVFLVSRLKAMSKTKTMMSPKRMRSKIVGHKRRRSSNACELNRNGSPAGAPAYQPPPATARKGKEREKRKRCLGKPLLYTRRRWSVRSCKLGMLLQQKW
jgi:hypothetical protein